MSADKTLWVIVTPVYLPAPGGGAIYTDTLARALAAEGRNVLVLTEAFPGQPDVEHLDVGPGSVTVDRLFPFRAGRSELDLRAYFDYARQNVKMLRLPRRAEKFAHQLNADRCVVLVHSSFFCKPSLLPYVLSAIGRLVPGRTRLVADVRDPALTASDALKLKRFDGVIGCSRTISDKLQTILGSKINVSHIPIPFKAAETPTEKDVSDILEETGLSGTNYILNPNGISERKSHPLMLDVVRFLRTMPGHENTKLVTIGRSRDWGKRDEMAEREGVLRYLGSVPNRKMLALAKGAKAVLILSEVEGLPRSSLEAFALETPVIAPNLPEFSETIPEAVVSLRDPQEIARQIVAVCNRNAPQAYPLERHSMSNLIKQYQALEPA